MFSSLHAMFQTQYTELWNAVDPIAERIRALGARAPGSYGQFQALTSVPDAEPVAQGARHGSHPGAGPQTVARTARGIFFLVEQAGDQPSADLLTQPLDSHENRVDAA